MLKLEFIARAVVILLVSAAAGLPFLFHPDPFDRSSSMSEANTLNVTLRARMPENGGWSHESIRLEVGQPLHLRMTADDVVHSFALGQSGQPAIDLIPGEWTETTLVFDRPGKYTYYCTRWCGANHWRMRGTIEVSGPGEDQPSAEPLFVQLGIDLDAPRTAGPTPPTDASAERGARLADQLPDFALERDTYLTHSPAELWQALRAEPGLSRLTDAELWDAVAYIWQENTSPAALARGRELYAQNCAACHGESGQGDGVMLPLLAKLEQETPAHGMADHQPPDFSDPQTLAGASPALLEGKLLRGGMGTSMPYWGPIFTQEELDAVVAFLYTLAEERPQPAGD